MIALDLPVWVLWLLRWGLFLGPLAATLLLGWRARLHQRRLTGALFAFLYGLGTIFVTHEIAFLVGWWRYGGDTLMLMGLPADIWLGGAMVFGPALFLAFPKASPVVLLLPIAILLHGLFFLSLPPLVLPGPHWYTGVVFVFALAHLPALYLARWTAEERNLGGRASLLAFGYGWLAFALLPSVIMVAMGGSWLSLLDRPWWVLSAGAMLFAAFMVLGLTAVQMFVVHGQGTPIPLDPTQRLVGSGIFAYVRNPMQLTTAAAWVVEGALLQSFWVASAAIMAWVFVAGMVRWHHRYDLELRFPEGWSDYCAHVPEWLPRWRPWLARTSTLVYDPSNARHARLANLISCVGATSLDVRRGATGALVYADGLDGTIFTGMGALAKAIGHSNFVSAMIGAGLLLVALPAAEIKQRFCSSQRAGSERRGA